MRKYLNLVPLIVIFLASCQKEISTEVSNSQPGGGGSTPQDSLLAKVVIQGGTDSIVSNFSYDNSRRLTFLKSISAVQGVKDTTTWSIQRNTQGIIVQLTG